MSIDILALANKASEQRQADLEGVEIKTSTNLDIKVGQLNPFTGSWPVYNPKGAAGAGPTHFETNLPCALDLRGEDGHGKGVSLGVVEGHGFKQPKGGQEKAEQLRAEGKDVEMMTQVEFVASLKGARIGFIHEGEFVPHPMYSEERLSFVTERDLELYCKTPFKTPAEIAEAMRLAFLEHGFEQVELGDRERPARRQDLFHLGAKHNGGNGHDRIVARQENAFPLASLTLTAPRPVEDRPATADGSVRAEFEDFMRSIEMNLHRVTVELGAGTSTSKAGRLSSAITGVDGQYPLRATAASFTHNKMVLGGIEPVVFNFFAPSAQPAA